MTQDVLRVFVEAVGRDVARLSERPSSQEAEGIARLAGSWARLVEFLALGPAPELRACPACGAMGMRAATLCGYCWKKLVPPDGRPAEAR